MLSPGQIPFLASPFRVSSGNFKLQPPGQSSLKRQIDATDSQIDALVYELYGLTEEEINIVEGTG